MGCALCPLTLELSAQETQRRTSELSSSRVDPEASAAELRAPRGLFLTHLWPLPSGVPCPPLAEHTRY